VLLQATPPHYMVKQVDVYIYGYQIIYGNQQVARGNGYVHDDELK